MKNDDIPRHIQLYLFTHLDIYVDYKPVAVDYSRIVHVDLCQWRTWALVVVDPARQGPHSANVTSKQED